MQKEITVQDIGSVLISKKSNATRLKIRVHPEKGVLVTIPYYSKYSEGEKFIYKNLNWVKDKLANQEKKKKANLFTPENIFMSRKSVTRFFTHDKNSFIARIKNYNIDFYYNPLLVDFTNEDVQSFIKKNIIRGLKIEAEDYLLKRIEYLSDKTGLKYRKASIGNAGTRWGCCSGYNDIILSCRLLLLPDYLIDYIILHELCHIPYKNHGSEFYSLLDKLSGGQSDELNRELKKFSINPVPGDFRYVNQ